MLSLLLALLLLVLTGATAQEHVDELADQRGHVDDRYYYYHDDDDGYYAIVDLDPKAPSNAIERAYMQCFLPFDAPQDGSGAWRVVDRTMQVHVCAWFGRSKLAIDRSTDQSINQSRRALFRQLTPFFIKNQINR